MAWFDDIVSFSTAWNNIKHREIKNFFFDETTNKIQTHLVVDEDNKSEEKRINAMSLFESTIAPKWEDVINKYGGEFRVEFSAKIA